MHDFLSVISQTPDLLRPVMKQYLLLSLSVIFLSIPALPETPPGSEMIFIPGGWFEMGSLSGARDERPVHRVFIDSFYLSRSEVSIWEYLECVKDGRCELPVWWDRFFFGSLYSQVSGHDWFKMPVVGVSWDDAMKYCRWKGETFRLPTEAEWEYAARAGTSGLYFWGDEWDGAADYAVAGERLCPVMSKKPNAFGLFDMTGNVWEWCLDFYDKNYYSISANDNPEGPETVRKRVYRVVRGGARNEYPWNQRVANRSFGEPHRRYDGVGFRICKTAGDK
jgi:formylglycine-generating enzyme required for sulfatase activity